MNNIFENAYFGKLYKTRDGRKAVFYMVTDFGVSLLTEKYGLEHYHLDGIIFNCITEDDNIVSEWQESINEEELDKLAEESLKESGWGDSDNSLDSYVDGYKVGYRKAMKKNK